MDAISQKIAYATAGVPPTKRHQQFSIAEHYDAMEELDADVHEDETLSQIEVDTALGLITEKLGRPPKTIFMPCFGTGRHIKFLLEAGVDRIVGVDLSPKCVTKARRNLPDLNNGQSVQFIIGDLAEWKTREEFDAAILLGNSFGDIIDSNLLLAVTKGMTQCLTFDGVLVMDYVGRNYLPRCQSGHTSVWKATFNGQTVRDERTPHFDAKTNVMSVNITLLPEGGKSSVIWSGCYQKIIMSPDEVAKHFAEVGVEMECIGKANDVNAPYFSATDPQHPLYTRHNGNLGMIQLSDWYIGQKTGK